jgi:hypothetical protein
MLLYHGTSSGVAQALAAAPNTISVARGGGELGRGFYAGDHVALAAAWARGRFPASKVLEVDIDTSAYAQLMIHILNWTQVVNTWNQLKTSGTTRTYLFHSDVVHGPLATYPHAAQHKFESSNAERVLQASSWRAL